MPQLSLVRWKRKSTNSVMSKATERISPIVAATRPGRTGAVRAVDRILPVLLVVGAVLVLVWCYRTGDAGAQAVWSGTGT